MEGVATLLEQMLLACLLVLISDELIKIGCSRLSGTSLLYSLLSVLVKLGSSRQNSLGTPSIPMTVSVLAGTWSS